MAAIIGINAKVEVQTTLGSPLTVTAVTLANPGVATSTAHGLTNGDVVFFTVAAGMVQLDGQAVRVANVAANTFELEGLSTTSYDAFTAGTATEVVTFTTLASARSVNMADAPPATHDASTLLDGDEPVLIYGRRPASEGSIVCLFNPAGVAEGLIIAAATTNSTLVFRFSYSGNTKHSIVNAHVSGGQGFGLSPDAIAEVTMNLTRVRKMVHYAT